MLPILEKKKININVQNQNQKIPNLKILEKFVADYNDDHSYLVYIFNLDSFMFSFFKLQTF